MPHPTMMCALEVENLCCTAHVEVPTKFARSFEPDRVCYCLSKRNSTSGRTCSLQAALKKTKAKFSEEGRKSFCVLGHMHNDVCVCVCVCGLNLMWVWRIPSGGFSLDEILPLYFAI